MKSKIETLLIEWIYLGEERDSIILEEIIRKADISEFPLNKTIEKIKIKLNRDIILDSIGI